MTESADGDSEPVNTVKPTETGQSHNRTTTNTAQLHSLPADQKRDGDNDGHDKTTGTSEFGQNESKEWNLRKKRSFT